MKSLFQKAKAAMVTTQWLLPEKKKPIVIMMLQIKVSFV